MVRNFTDITILLDRSGSMATIADAVVQGVSEFIEKVNAAPGDGCWTLLQFDDPASARGADERFPHVVYAQVPCDKVPSFTRQDFNPRGGTALVDALYITLSDLEKRYLALSEDQRPQVMVVVQTDGAENASRQHTTEKLRELTARVQNVYGFEILYLGANQDAFAVARDMGVLHRNACNYVADHGGTRQVFNSNALKARRWKSEGNDTADVLQGDGTPDQVMSTGQPPAQP